MRSWSIYHRKQYASRTIKSFKIMIVNQSLRAHSNPFQPVIQALIQKTADWVFDWTNQILHRVRGPWHLLAYIDSFCDQLILYCCLHCRWLLLRKFCWTRETTEWWPTRKIFRSGTGWTRERLELLQSTYLISLELMLTTCLCMFQFFACLRWEEKLFLICDIFSRSRILKCSSHVEKYSHGWRHRHKHDWEISPTAYENSN